MADKYQNEREPSVPTAVPIAPPATDPSALDGGPLSYKIRVENYFGPLDLLLHLVREAEVDITRVSLAKVAEQYIAYITAMQKLDLHVAGEFLAVASQLMLIKSRTLVPPELGAVGEEESDEDAASSVELIRKLLDYKRFKDRAATLGRLFEERLRRFVRPALELESDAEPPPVRDLEIWDLVLVFSRLIRSTRLDAALTILYEDIPIEVWIETILKALEGKKSMGFFELIGPQRDRAHIVGTFLAVLQLARDQRLKIIQNDDLKEIRLEATDPAPTPRRNRVDWEQHGSAGDHREE
ncbi:MAG: segregation/condensation protein A [Planctomycetes bacterium]|nr:segregation/condensation protein A [Planctomycetota bacterium]